MLESHDAISRLSRMYFAYIYLTGSGGGGGGSGRGMGGAGDRGPQGLSRAGAGAGAGATVDDTEMDAPFARPLVLGRLGHFIMEVKVSQTNQQ
jgi:hypothetical protein